MSNYYWYEPVVPELNNLHSTQNSFAFHDTFTTLKMFQTEVVEHKEFYSLCPMPFFSTISHLQEKL
jgi:hypothetical protein